MIRYNRALAEFDLAGVADFTRALNGKRFKFDEHFFMRLGQRFTLPEQAKVGLFLQSLRLDAKDCFEYYRAEGGIARAGYRMPFTDDKDLIIIVTKNKYILTVYTNYIWDNHATLNKAIYNKRTLVRV